MLCFNTIIEIYKKILKNNSILRRIKKKETIFDFFDNCYDVFNVVLIFIYFFNRYFLSYFLNFNNLFDFAKT